MLFFFFNDTATTEIYTLSLHDALPIYLSSASTYDPAIQGAIVKLSYAYDLIHYNPPSGQAVADRKSTRLNSSHAHISYAVFFLEKKKKNIIIHYIYDVYTLI